MKSALLACLSAAAVLAALTMHTVAVAACAAMARQEKNMVLTESDNGKEVILSSKAVLTLKLSAQLGTGYGWDIAEIDKGTIEPVGKPTLETGGKEGVGRPELQVFMFKPVKPGKTVLKMRYVRPWEKDVKPMKTFSVTVTVE